MTIQEIRREARKMDRKLKPDDIAFDATVLLLTLVNAEVPWTVKALTNYTGIRETRVGDMLRRLRANGVIKGKTLDVEWADEETGVIAFWLDVNVAIGHMARSTKPGRTHEVTVEPW